MRIALLASLVLSVVACAAPQESNHDEVEETSSPLYVRPAQYRWPGRIIPVCFFTGGYDYEKAFARNVIRDTFEKESNLVFTIWGDCQSATSPGIHLGIGTTTAPCWQSATERQPSGFAVGNLMVCPGDPLRFRAHVLRAFGTMLGFLPEDARVSQQCGPAVDTTNAITIGAYDQFSATNRCALSTALTPTDIGGVQRFYGSPTPLASNAVPTGGALPFVFARGTDNTLVENVWNGSVWTWTPHGEQLGGTPTVVVRGNERRVFVRLATGQLGERVWNGTTWSWVTHDVQMTGTPSAVVTSDGTIRVFFRHGTALYEHRLVGTTWTQLWRGGSIETDPSAVLRTPTTVSVFAMSGQRLNELRESGGQLFEVVDHSEGGTRLIRSAPKAIATNGDIKVFARGTDDSLWEASSQGAVWTWTWHNRVMWGEPSIQSATSIFIRGTDDRLWQRWHNGTQWTWVLHDGVTITSSPTAVFLNGHHKVFVRDPNGAVAERFWSNNQWWWSVHPQNNILP